MPALAAGMSSKAARATSLLLLLLCCPCEWVLADLSWPFEQAAAEP